MKPALKNPTQTQLASAVSQVLEREGVLKARAVGSRIEAFVTNPFQRWPMPPGYACGGMVWVGDENLNVTYKPISDFEEQISE